MQFYATAALALLGLVPAAMAGPVWRRDDLHYISNATRAEAVKQTFQISWDGYMKYAFPHDSLQPVSMTWTDDRNGWGASAVDALSTALVMEKWDVVYDILEFVPKINFTTSPTNDSISLFETTIRYLGGLVSAYDLLSGPLKGHVNDTTLVKAVLDQAESLASNLRVAFETPSGVPDNDVFFDPPRIRGSSTNGIATIGTLVLEWTRLADLTGNKLYSQLVQRGEKYLLEPQPALGEPFPGLLGTDVNITTGLFVSSSGSWGGGDDSFYEYLIKMYLYDPIRFSQYRDRWIEAVESSIKHLSSHPTSRPDVLFLAAWSNASSLTFISQHLACFNGGNFILGGLTLDEPRYVEFGLELVNGCHDTYISTETQIGPELFRWQDSATSPKAPNNPKPPSNWTDFYDKAGFWIPDGWGTYDLRPEVLESYYYAYRATGNRKYQEWAWDAFLAINSTCAVGAGYSSLNNVNMPAGGGYGNVQESFWFAEVLKYAYLIFAEEAPWQVRADHTNEFVYNTEAHPVRLAAKYER